MKARAPFTEIDPRSAPRQAVPGFQIPVFIVVATNPDDIRALQAWAHRHGNVITTTGRGAAARFLRKLVFFD